MFLKDFEWQDVQVVLHIVACENFYVSKSCKVKKITEISYSEKWRNGEWKQQFHFHSVEIAEFLSHAILAKVSWK